MRRIKLSGILRYKSPRKQISQKLGKTENLVYSEIPHPVDNRAEIKEIEKGDKYLDIARGVQKLWNMKVTVIQIVTGVWNGP